MTISPSLPSTSFPNTRTISSARVERDGHRVRVALYGDIDMATAGEALAMLREAMDGPYERLDVDLADVNFLDSSGITMLVRSWRRADKLGCRLRVINARPHVYRVLQIAGVVDVLDVTRPA